MKNLPTIDEFYAINEDAKDEMRINDIVKKSSGNQDKQIQLANTMAKSISDKGKAIRRYEAAVKLLSSSDPIAVAFATRANELGAHIPIQNSASTTDTTTKDEYQYDEKEALKIQSTFEYGIVSKLRGFNWGTPFITKLDKQFTPSQLISLAILYRQENPNGYIVSPRNMPKLSSAVDSLNRYIKWNKLVTKFDMGDAKTNPGNPAHFLFKDEIAQDKAAADLQILKDACKEAYENYKAPTYLFEPGEKYTNYMSQNGRSGEIVFNDPWAMYFWNHNMIGQMSDGYWENSRKYADAWRFWSSLTPVFNPTKKYHEKNDYSDIQNPKVVQQYAVQSDAEYIAIGKIAVMKDSELLVFVKYGDLSPLDYRTVKSIENATKIAQDKGISIETYLAFLWEPGLNKSQVNKLVSDAHSNMRDAMVSFY